MTEMLATALNMQFSLFDSIGYKAAMQRNGRWHVCCNLQHQDA